MKSIEKCAESLASRILMRAWVWPTGNYERDLERVMSDFIIVATTYSCARPLSKRGSMSLPPIPLSLKGLTPSGWPSCTSYADGWDALITKPMPICSRPAPEPLRKTPVSDSKPFQKRRIWAPALRWRHDLEIRGAGELLGEVQSGHFRPSGSVFTCNCSKKPSRR